METANQVPVWFKTIVVLVLNQVFEEIDPNSIECMSDTESLIAIYMEYLRVRNRGSEYAGRFNSVADIQAAVQKLTDQELDDLKTYLASTIGVFRETGLINMIGIQAISDLVVLARTASDEEYRRYCAENGESDPGYRDANKTFVL